MSDDNVVFLYGYLGNLSFLISLQKGDMDDKVLG